MTAEGLPATPDPKGPIVARAGRYYRVTRYIMTFILFVYGGWSIYDGFYSWPNWPISHPDEKPKTPIDILFNKILGCALPPAGILLLIRCRFNSRGEYRLENGVVRTPGHPPVPLDKIQTVDRELWERKGIAYIDYQLDPGTAGDPKREKGTFVLDDFVYEREPTDAIFNAIEAALLKGHPSTAVAPTASKPAAPVAKAPVAKPAVAGAPAVQKAVPRPATPIAKPASVVKPVPIAKPAPASKPGAPGVPPANRPPVPKTPPRPRL
jgi:hypothetical protein